jgi:hypothetical protein
MCYNIYLEAEVVAKVVYVMLVVVAVESVMLGA